MLMELGCGATAGAVGVEEGAARQLMESNSMTAKIGESSHKSREHSTVVLVQRLSLARREELRRDESPCEPGWWSSELALMGGFDSRRLSACEVR